MLLQARPVLPSGSPGSSRSVLPLLVGYRSDKFARAREVDDGELSASITSFPRTIETVAGGKGQVNGK